MLNAEQIGSYKEQGFFVAENLVAPAKVDQLMQNFVALLNEMSGESFASAHSPEVASYLNRRKDIQTGIYDKIREPDWTTKFSLLPEIVSAAKSIVGAEIGMFRKIPFRIDAPMETSQLAVWHQDYFYVRGNADVLTAWIPMQDTVYKNGCIAVMPGSHKLGPIDHDVNVLEKRHYPSGVFKDGMFRYVEVKKGDIVFFHSCLLHSSTINISDTVRYSLQARYTPLGRETDPGMQGVIPVQN
jgi:ectoine hydroxylase-related dioxygenase (phytanoyl-CoA dioxygenase family)